MDNSFNISCINIHQFSFQKDSDEVERTFQSLYNRYVRDASSSSVSSIEENLPGMKRVFDWPKWMIDPEEHSRFQWRKCLYRCLASSFLILKQKKKRKRKTVLKNSISHLLEEETIWQRLVNDMKTNQLLHCFVYISSEKVSTNSATDYYLVYYNFEMKIPTSSERRAYSNVFSNEGIDSCRRTQEEIAHSHNEEGWSGQTERYTVESSPAVHQFIK